MFTIGKLAAYAGVTIKAVRHYHARGLLAEPERDASGYRRYTAEHATILVKIKTLADAGVPLARVKGLLDAEPAVLAAAVAEIDRDIAERIEALRRARERLAELEGGDRLYVSPEVADHLDELRAIGVSERQVRLERDGWILMYTATPEDAEAWLAEKRSLITDPEFRDFYLEMDAAYDWAPDDPRIPELAERLRRWQAGHEELPGTGDGDGAVVAELAAQYLTSPAWERIGRLAKS